MRSFETLTKRYKVMRKIFLFAFALAVGALAFTLSGCSLPANEPENPSGGSGGGGSGGNSSSSVAVNGCLPGKFSVSPSHKVSFSQGNLVYQASGNRFRFQNKQYQIVGGQYWGNIFHDGIRCCNEFAAKDYEGWIDLFGWGTANQPWLRGDAAFAQYTFHEWGDKSIENGGGSNAWRTLSASEWQYMLKERPNATYKVGMCVMKEALYSNIYLERNELTEDFEDHDALMLIPDDWTCPSGITFVPIGAQGDWIWMNSNAEWDIHGMGWWSKESYDADLNVYTISQINKLEASGVVFLPATGSVKYDGSYSYSSDMGNYWSCNDHYDPMNPDAKGAYAMCFKCLYPTTIAPAESCGVAAGYAIRLVKDVK